MSAGAIPVEPMVMGSTAPGVVYSAAPTTVQYVTQPAVQYVTTQPAVQYVGGGSSSVPMQYEYASATRAPMMYTTAAPAVYSISPERFAQIAAGIPLTQEEIAAISGGGALPAQGVSVPVEPAIGLGNIGAGAAALGSMGAAAVGSAAAVVGSAAAAVTSAKAEKGSKKKSLKKSSKKKKAGCC